MLAGGNCYFPCRDLECTKINWEVTKLASLFTVIHKNSCPYLVHKTAKLIKFLYYFKATENGVKKNVESA